MIRSSETRVREEDRDRPRMGFGEPDIPYISPNSG